MKTKLLLICITVQLLSAHIKAQWVQQNYGMTFGLSSIQFPTNNIGFIVGGVSKNPFNATLGTNVVYKTVNGGNTWYTVADSINPAELRKCFFVSDSVGYAVGEDGTVLKTSNGGINWNIKNPTYRLLNDVFFLNKNTGYIVGEAGIIMKTIDAGNSWQTQNCNCSIGNGSYLNGVYFVDSLIGFAVGGQPKAFIKTIDGGVNWTQITFPSQSSSLQSVYFFNADTGFVAGAQEIYRTFDGGANWTTVYTGGSLGSSIFFCNSSVGYVSGQSGKIYKTADGGSTWVIQNTNTGINISSIFMFDSLNGFAVGPQGFVFKTNNGGWTSINENLPSSSYAFSPNPFHDFAILSVEKKVNDSFALLVFNSTGQLVENIQYITSDKIIFERKNLSNGLYFYRLTNNERTVKIGKLVIN